jgi:aminopeptidase N
MLLLAALAILPLRYDLTLAPRDGGFDGSEQIELALAAPSPSIRLDAVDLDVRRAVVLVQGRPLAITIHRQSDAVILQGRFPAGKLLIELSWRGRLSPDRLGLYASGDFLFTQLEPEGARRLFPCFDRPGLRARFRIHALVKAAETAISNGATVSDVVDGDSRRLDFAETPPLPTYLVALAVGRFDMVAGRAGDVPVRVIAPPGRHAAAQAALETTIDFLERLQRYLGVPYPFAKLDVVAAPDLPVQAMENAGAIFVGAEALLRPDRTQARRLAHELAHQWFGDLVTMASWRDLWLSEALSRWAEFQILDEAHPEWQMWTEFQRLRDHALAIDSRHAIRTAPPSFDPITYDKGAAALWMLQSWMSPESFRGALHDYLAEHAFGAVTAEDFWATLAAHSSVEVAQLGRSWFDRAGHPTLEVESRCRDGALEVRLQQGSHPIWPLPVRLETPATVLHLLLRHARQTLLLREPGGCPAWVTADGDQPYRVRYSSARR